MGGRQLSPIANGSRRDIRSNAGYQIDLVQRGETPSDFRPMPDVGLGAMEIRVHGENDVGGSQVILGQQRASAGSVRLFTPCRGSRRMDVNARGRIELLERSQELGIERRRRRLQQPAKSLATGADALA